MKCYTIVNRAARLPTGKLKIQEFHTSIDAFNPLYPRSLRNRTSTDHHGLHNVVY